MSYAFGCMDMLFISLLLFKSMVKYNNMQMYFWVYKEMSHNINVFLDISMDTLRL